MNTSKLSYTNAFLLNLLLVCQVGVIAIPIGNILLENDSKYMELSNTEKSDAEKEKSEEDIKEELKLTELYEYNSEDLNPFSNFGSNKLMSLHAIEAVTPPPELI